MTLRQPKGTILALAPQDWVEIELTVDSGACDTVMPASMCGHVSMTSTHESRAGLEYEVANGASIPSLGERRCFMMTENSNTMKRIVFQCDGVHKALLSVANVADLAYECIMTKDGGCLKDEVTRDVIPLHRRGILYYTSMDEPR